MDLLDAKTILQVAYGLTLLSFAFRTISTLRILAILASLTTIYYCSVSAREMLWLPCLWNALFIAVNAGQLFYSRWQKNNTSLDPVETFLAKTVLENFPSSEVRSFTRIARGDHIPAGQRLIECGTKIEELYCLLSGEADISEKGVHITKFGPGKFLGEMSLLTKSSTRADVVAATDLRVLLWTHDSIDAWVAEDPLRLGLLQTALGRQVVEELLQQRVDTEEMRRVVA